MHTLHLVEDYVTARVFECDQKLCGIRKHEITELDSIYHNFPPNYFPFFDLYNQFNWFVSVKSLK